MLFVLLAKIMDPVVLLLGLVGGRLSRSWLHVGIVAAIIAVGEEVIVSNGSPEGGPVILGFCGSAIWASMGFALRKVGPKVALGNHLTKMTNWMEAMETTRRTMPIGAGGGIDGLPRDQQARAIMELKAGRAAIAKFPRHVITAELIKNRQVALQLGRHTRAEAIGNLLEHLIEQNLALGAEDFLKSYA